MTFKQHYNLKDRHAFLSPSKYSWVNYDDEKLDNYYIKWHAKELGTRFHVFAKQAIELGVKMPTENWTLYMYINDCIDYNLTPEQPLYYSENAFGTADAIGFDEENKILYIFDLKTGATKASMTQLYIYDALFCLEYNIDPFDITMQNRIYQSNSVSGDIASPDVVRDIMDKIIIFDKRIEFIKRGGV